MLSRPVVGASAPSINLRTQDATPWRLTDHAGTHVVVIFHRHIH